MKKMILILLSCICYPINAQNETELITIETYIPTTTYQAYTYPKVPENRLKSGANAKFIVDYNGQEWTLEEKNALETAFRLWEDKLPFNGTIKISVQFEVFSDNTLIKTKFYETNIKNSSNPLVLNGFRYPNILLKYLSFPTTEFISDVEFLINSDKDIWNFNSEGQSSTNKVDFITVLLREFAKVFGFSSSLSNASTNPIMRNPKIYDKFLITSNDEFIYSADRNLLQGMITNLVYWNGTKAGSHAMYTPNPALDNMSLNYFNEQDAVNDSEKKLMQPTLKNETVIHDIGETVLNVLCDLGWDKKPSNVKITSTQVLENGTINLNTPYTFQSNIGTMSVQSYKWTFEVMQEDGTFITLNTLNNVPVFSFTTNISSGFEYARTSNGEVRSRVKLEYTDLLNEQKEVYYNLSLLFTPTTPEVKIKSITPINDWYSAVTIEYYAVGAQQYTLFHEEIGYPSIPGVITYNNGGYMEHTFPIVYNDAFHLFEVNAINIWGSRSYVLEYDPYAYEGMDTFMSINNNNQSLKIGFNTATGMPVNKIIQNENINIFDIFSGRKQQVLKLGNNEIDINNLVDGIYVITYKDEKGKIYNIKFIKNKK
jgi:hypothetical protein